jgi:hypothetical protein
MKKKTSQLLLVAASSLIFAVANIGTAFAQLTVNHRYQVSTSAKAGNPAAIVETSAGNEIVGVAIQRPNQPTHFYNSYVQIKVSAARIGRQPLYTIYHDDERIQAGQFDKKFSEAKGLMRSRVKEVVNIHKQLEEDMEILRAVRAYDKNADVLLAELAYSLVTYDNKILDALDNNAPTKFNVTEIELTSNIAKKDETRYKADKAEFARVSKTASLNRQTGDDLKQVSQSFVT